MDSRKDCVCQCKLGSGQKKIFPCGNGSKLIEKKNHCVQNIIGSTTHSTFKGPDSHNLPRLDLLDSHINSLGRNYYYSRLKDEKTESERS